MAKTFRTLCLPPVMLWLLGGCVAQPDPAGKTANLDMNGIRRSATASEAAKARALAARGELHAALQAWQIVHALGIDQQTANREIAALEAQIAAAVAEHVAAGKSELNQGRWRIAKRHLLTALALEPKNRSAQDALRGLEGRRALAQLDKTPVLTATAPAYTPPPEPAIAKPEADPPEAISPAATAPAPVSDEDRKSEAQQAYKRGLGLYSSDKSAAATAFKQAIELDPAHAKAQAYLKVLKRLGVQ